MEEEKIEEPKQNISLRKMILEKYPDFFKELDSNLRLFAREIRKDLRAEGHVVTGITGYPGVGKSNDTAILGALIDENYNFKKNICFIPTSKEIEGMYLSLPMYSFLHIDEASKSMHKHKWQEKVQQKLNELYDTDREGHFLCTALLMPRFNNFTENFRNFMIKYWIDIPCKGLAVFYKRDEDKDCKDPWHMDESYKLKKQRWRGKRVFERGVGERISAEQRTECYWFYCKIPAVPKDIWEEYQQLKKQSRIDSMAKEPEIDAEDYRDKIQREKYERWNRIGELRKAGITTAVKQAVVLKCSEGTIRRSWNEMKAYAEMKGTTSKPILPNELNLIYNQRDNPSLPESCVEGDKVLFVANENKQMDELLGEKE